MNLVLINPPYSVKQRYDSKYDLKKGYLPPLGLSYLATMIYKKHNVKILDLQLFELTNEEILKKVMEHEPDLICFTSLTPTINIALKLAKYIKDKTELPIIFGGPHVSCFPEQTLKENPFINLVVIGEGEYTISDVIDYYEGKKKLEDIPGIAYKDKDEININAVKPIMDLNELPMPKREFFDMKLYVPLPNQYKRLPVTNMITSRGCNYGKCTFCFSAGRLGPRYRRISVDRAIEEIKYLMKDYGIREISFWDDQFVNDKAWIDEFCDRLINEKIDITWACLARVSFVTEELLQKMAKAGCWNIFYGIESGNQELLNKIKKGISLEQIRRAVKWTKKAGIETRGSFMLALPGETPEMAKKTIDFAIEIDVDYAQFCITTPYPGTELFDICKNEGQLSLTYDDYSGHKSVFIPNGYKDAEEIRKMRSLAYNRFYFRFGYVWGRIKRIRSLSDITKYLTGLKLLVGMR